jgi:hypothetical protein
MLARRRGRRAALLCGGVLCLAAALAIPFWREIVAGYHEVRIRMDRGLILEAIRAPEESGLRRGLERYVKSAEGKSALLDLFLDSFLRKEPALEEAFLDSTSVEIRVGEGSQVFYYLPRAGGMKGGGAFPSSERPQAPPEIESIASQLARLEGWKLRATRYPGWLFHVRGKDPERQKSLVLIDARPEPVGSEETAQGR